MPQTQNLQSDQLSSGCVVSNRYEIVSKLGTGGMGSVYRAKDRLLEGNEVAIKVLHRELVQDQDQTKRFLREVQLMHRVSHVNVVRTYDVGRDGKLVYFTMEFLKGQALDEFLNSKLLDLKTFARIAVQICNGMEAIHAAGIIHRDLKLPNILLDSNESVKIADFGVARPKTSDLTQQHEIIGSVQYMAPEIWLGHELTFAIDYYSLGVIFYKMCTNQLPFSGDEPATLLWMHVRRPPPSSVKG